MDPKTCWESLKVEGENVIGQVKQAVREGNVRRVVVKHEGRTIAEFPLTAGVVAAVLAPVLSAIAAIIALLKDCTIDVERSGEPAPLKEPQPVAAGPIDELC
ncbi:MAG: DUF4342 domain-containing protein [Acidobacteriota bacterium]